MEMGGHGVGPKRYPGRLVNYPSSLSPIASISAISSLSSGAERGRLTHRFQLAHLAHRFHLFHPFHLFPLFPRLWRRDARDGYAALSSVPSLSFLSHRYSISSIALISPLFPFFLRDRLYALLNRPAKFPGPEKLLAVVQIARMRVLMKTTQYIFFFARYGVEKRGGFRIRSITHREML